MESVPNCWKQIANTYPIRWFKCKLKLPKNAYGYTINEKICQINSNIGDMLQGM